MKIRVLVLSVLIFSASVVNAKAQRVAGGLYDRNGNLINADFSPEDKHGLNAPTPTEPVEWKFGNKQINTPPPAMRPGDPLPAAYRPAFGTYGVTHKWGDPNEFPCATPRHPFASCR